MAMHPSSFDKVSAFARKYLDARRHEPLVILDLGSQDYNGSYRPLFDQPPWRYLGVDVAPGKNVDVVLREPYRWREIKEGSADVIVSGQTFEHTEFFWLTMREIARALKTGGLACIIAPSAGDEHRYPVDCWRVYPDGLRAAARYAGLETIEAWTQWEDLPRYDHESNKWHDSVLVARKPDEKLTARWRRRFDRWVAGNPLH
jgi:SAM-dependent methyltransferase